MTTLLWLTGLFFAALLPWGTNVPTEGRATLVKVFVIFNICVHMITQGFMHQSHSSEWSSADTRSHADVAQQHLERYIDFFAIVPCKVQDEGGWRWGQLITANFIHGGWLHLTMNMWMFALYGQNLEGLFGRRKFLLFLIAAMLGSQLAVLMFTRNSAAYEQPHAGFSGVVYAVLAAYLVCFPRSKVKVALIYDLRFWGCVVFLLLPAIFIFSTGSPSFSELLLVLGVIVLFGLIQPEHVRFGLPAFVLLGYKLMQDALSFERQIDEFSISVWSHAGGLMVGTVAGLWINGTKGLYQTWDDPDAPTTPRRAKSQKASLAKLEAAAQTDPEAAKTFLGQRVFVGDAVRATKFYEEVVMTKFPDLQLDPRELHSLARMLEFKGMDAAALDAYERLLRCHPLPAGFESAWMQAARLCSQVQPDRVADCLRYLKRFEEDSGLMRDKFEARRLRTEILDAAAQRGLNVSEVEAEAASAPIPGAAAYESPSPSGYGGPAQPERRRNVRAGSRMQQIAPLRPPSLEKLEPEPEPEPEMPVKPPKPIAPEPLPPVTPPKPPTQPEPEPLPPPIKLPVNEPQKPSGESPQGLPGWGKKPLPLKFKDKAVEIARARLEDKIPNPPPSTDPSPPEAPPPPPAPADEPPPPLPKGLEQRLGLRTKRPPRVDLSNLTDPPPDTSNSTDEPEPN